MQPNARTSALGQKMTGGLNFAKNFGQALGQNLGKTALNVGKSVLASPIRVGASLAEAPMNIASGGQKTFKPFNVPLLGQVKTYARDAQDRINQGDGSKLTTASTILGVGGQSILDTAALGSAAQSAKNFFGKNTGVPAPTGGSTGGADQALRSRLNETTAGQLQNTNLLNKGRAYTGSVEALSEQANGWMPGMKYAFDTALKNGDKLTIKALINQGAVPAEYLKTFSSNIGKILGGAGALGAAVFPPTGNTANAASQQYDSGKSYYMGNSNTLDKAYPSEGEKYGSTYTPENQYTAQGGVYWDEAAGTPRAKIAIADRKNQKVLDTIPYPFTDADLLSLPPEARKIAKKFIEGDTKTAFDSSINSMRNAISLSVRNPNTTPATYRMNMPISSGAVPDIYPLGVPMTPENYQSIYGGQGTRALKNKIFNR